MHEILLRGLIRVFGAVFPCIRLEAKYLDGPQNGAFEVALRSRAVSAALSGAAQEPTQQPGCRGKPRGGSERRRGGKQGEEQALQTQLRSFWAVLHGQ